MIFLNRFYWPDVAATGQMLTDLAEDLAALGWDVTVVTGSAGYEGNKDPAPATEHHNGVRVFRVRGTRRGRHRLLDRALDQATYIFGAALRLMRLPRPDVVVAMSDPPLLLPLAVLMRRTAGPRAVYWLQDIFPQLAGKFGVLNPAGTVYSAWDSLARWLYKRCDLIVALGPAMADAALKAGVPPDRTRVIHNWADARSIRPVPRGENPLARELGFTNEFIVMYSGNAGRVHTFDAVVEAMRRLGADSGVLFVFIGGGARMGELKRVADAERLANVKFFDYFAREQLSSTLSAADVGLVTEDPRAAGLVVPSKIYGILASARPVIFVGAEACDVARIVRESGAGYVVPSDDPEVLVRAILELKNNPDNAAKKGERGRRAAEERYDRRIATRAWSDALAVVISGKRESAELTATDAAATLPFA